jgi:hypothetical protein
VVWFTRGLFRKYLFGCFYHVYLFLGAGTWYSRASTYVWGDECGGENCCGLIFEAHLQLREFPQPRLAPYHVIERISTTAVLCKLEKKGRTKFLVAEWHFFTIELNTSYAISSTEI